jgi:protocatechuate 3,4-dioxygenase beta subunit
MEAKNRIVLAVVVVGLLAGLWFALSREWVGAPRIDGEEQHGVATGNVVSSTVQTATAPAALESAAPTGAADAEAKVSDGARVQLAASKNATLRGRCVDVAGQPLADCTVRLNGWEANDERMDKWLLDHATKPEWQRLPEVRTGLDGAFSFTFWPPPPFQFALDVSHDGRGQMSARWSSLAEGADTKVGDVVMGPGVRVTGRVVDVNGQPQGKEYVMLSRQRGAGLDGRPTAVSGEQTVSKPDGTFATYSWLEPGEYEVRTREFELESPKALTLTAERPTEDITVIVKARANVPSITGRVLDETGAPAAFVDIEDRSPQGARSRTRSNRDGTFELRRTGNGPDNTARLQLVADRYDVEDREGPREVEWGATGVEFRVTHAGALTLRVCDERQVAVENYTVRLIPRNRGRWSSSDARPRAQGKHEDGTVVIDGLTRGDWLLLVDFPSATQLTSLFEEFRQETTGPRRMDLRALPAVERTLRVVAADESPVANTKVQLCDPFDKPLDDARLVMQRDQWLMNAGSGNALVLYEGETGADGRLTLRGPGGRTLGLFLLGPGHIPLRQSNITLDVADECVVHVSRGARLVGKICPPEAVAELKRLSGSSAGGGFRDQYRPKVGLTDGQGNNFPRDHVTAGNLTGLRIADDGSFDIAGLPPGFWKLHIDGWIARERGASSHIFAAGEVNLVDGQTTNQDIDLECVLPGTVEGYVLLNGQPLANGTVTLRSEGTWENLQTNAEGLFTRKLFAGEYGLLVQKQGTAQSLTMLYCPTRVRVVRGQTTTQTFSVSCGKLRVTVRNASGQPVAKASIRVLGSEKDGTDLPPTNDQGVTETELTAESVTLRILPKAFSTPDAQRELWEKSRSRGEGDPLAPLWIQLTSAVLGEGQTTALEIRLPENSGY